MALKTMADGVHMLPVGAVNVFLIESEDGLTLVDAGFPNSEGPILQAITELGRAPEDLRHIVLTHAHPDHIGGAAALKRATGARTYMHASDKPIAERGSGFRPMSAAPGLVSAILFRLFWKPGATVAPVSVDQTVEDGDVLPIAGGLKIVHVPGHCEGQVALLASARGVLFTADACTNNMGLADPIGFEDLLSGRASQHRLSALEFDVAGFGHGKPIVRGASGRFRSKWG